MSLFIKKDLKKLIADAGDPNVETHSSGLKRHLNAFSLTLLGIGGIIGAGIFSLTGVAPLPVFAMPKWPPWFPSLDLPMPILMPHSANSSLGSSVGI
jgi:hypothetical protein